MPNITFCLSDGRKMEIPAKTGQTLMEAAVANDVPGILADCGGALACATCHVHLSDAGFAIAGGPSDSEDDMLDFTEADRVPTSRLSCQVVIIDAFCGATVIVPPGQA
ncbi:2Fe-2S iron-sulfur cluster-binding protein [Mesobacterium pallidum]|uniref:2Fe-2S iron-sulfur cluster-binding protein n=1 Tax=Mesobacterium pallidum TaxID=2872037 RepID=UPI001EE1DC19|nr:2Fe-2S iron-sulfur cluster-binding protein [Mesobacterium pallidum]